MYGQWGGKGFFREKTVINIPKDILIRYEEAAKYMVTGYEFTGSQNDAVEYVKNRFDGVDTLTLIAMWKALAAWDIYTGQNSDD